MVKIHLTKQQLPHGIVKAEELASPDKFVLGLIAHSVTKVEAVNELLARPAYEGKIEILPHQTNTALQVLNNFSHRALLADEVGLGKTIEAGIILKEYIARKLAKKILILTPATLKFQWQEEMRSKFDEDFEVADTPDVYKEYDKVISSIDTAKTERHKKVLEEIYWDLIIIDEAHKLKNSQTQNYKLVKSLHTERSLMLTATPLQNNIFELWALLDLLHPGFLGTKAKFTEQFLADKEGLKIKGKDELQGKLGKIMIRNMRKDTGIKFADRNVKTHLLNFSKEEMDVYTEVVAFVKREYEKIRDAEKPEDVKEGEAEDIESLSEAELKKIADTYRRKGLLTFALIMLTRQFTSCIRTGIEALKRYHDDLEDEKKQTELGIIIEKAKLIGEDMKMNYLLKLLKKEKEKVIIFTTFIHTQKILEMELALNGFSTVSFNGTMTPEEKEDAIEAFRGDKQILICTDAGSEGRNLQFAHILINYDLPWNPMRVEQRIGRVHRIGQKKDVIIHNIAVKDTIESYILNRLYEKINLFTVAIGEMDLILSQLKTKGTIEKTIFDSYMEEDDSFSEDLQQAQKKSEDIKDLDNDVFSWGAKNGS